MLICPCMWITICVLCVCNIYYFVLTVGEGNPITRISLFMTIQMPTILSIPYTLLALDLLWYLVHEAFIIWNTLSPYFKRESPRQVLKTVISKKYGMNELLTVIQYWYSLWLSNCSSKERQCSKDFSQRKTTKYVPEVITPAFCSLIWFRHKTIYKICIMQLLSLIDS